MKIIKILLGFVVLLGGLGFAAYYFGTNLASDALIEEVSQELESSGEMEQIKTVIESDPELKTFIEEGETADTNELPFTTKEEATRVLVKKVGFAELNEIREQVQNGTASKEEILNDIQSKLTEEEIMALKVIAYKELYSK